ncbi:thiol-disulfide oxidoreductase DCC family protein [Prochlorococcus marinus]|uniref:thiol-disulfide oxidoreductase DCC family protein n=1 Tax=Prochlorococcus marinus TaxID=1219 RepID=UPI0039AFF32C
MNTAKLTIFFDGGCPLCKREIDFLQSRNKKGYLSFIDINTSDFYLDLKYGITYKQAMERIHAMKSDGSVIKDIKVFQEAYNLVDLGWIYAPTKIPFFDKFIEFIYLIWAKYRLKLTFRPSIDQLCSDKGCEPF